LVVTNDHVVKALLKTPRPPNFPKDKFPFVAVLFHAVKPGDNPAIAEDSVAETPLEVLGIFRVEGIIPAGKGVYYGPQKPDFNIVCVKARDLPKAKLEPSTNKLVEGADVGTIGYPMGTQALKAPGWLHQFGPFLQRGSISAILPTRCTKPHSFVINLMSLGGASGSPVFLAENGHVIGILNSGLMQPQVTYSSDGNGLKASGFTQTPTNFTYVVPAYYIASSLKQIRADNRFALPPDTPTLKEIIQKSPAFARAGSDQMKPLKEICDGSNENVFDVHVEPVSYDNETRTCSSRAKASRCRQGKIGLHKCIKSLSHRNAPQATKRKCQF
jgi:hypothetical protein